MSSDLEQAPPPERESLAEPFENSNSKEEKSRGNLPLALLNVSNTDSVPHLARTRLIVLGGLMMWTTFTLVHPYYYSLRHRTESQQAATANSTILIIPSIARDLQASDLAVQWVINPFLQ